MRDECARGAVTQHVRHRGPRLDHRVGAYGQVLQRGAAGEAFGVEQPQDADLV